MQEIDSTNRESETSLKSYIVSHVARDSAKPFLITPDAGHPDNLYLSYGDLLQQAKRSSAFLRTQGIERGDKVGLLAGNGRQTTALILSVMLAGCVIVPLDTKLRPAQLAKIITHSDCKAIFVSEHEQQILTEALSLVSTPLRVWAFNVGAVSLFNNCTEDDLLDAEPGDFALLMYTSGTTGEPKGVLHNFASLLVSAKRIVSWHNLSIDDCVLSTLPICHINGFVIATLAPLLSGGCLVAPAKFSVYSWWEYVERFNCTWINVVPTIIAMLLLHAKGRGPHRHPSLRFARSASAPLPIEHHRAFETMFGVPVIEGMGMTESASTAFCNPMEIAKRKFGSVGLPCGVEAQVIVEGKQIAGTEELGEIVLRGPNIMAGYYKAEHLTESAIDKDGWLRTGDLGYRDSDGFFFITARLKELIIKGGENIAPREIEEIILLHPAILEAAVVGIPDDIFGQEILAAVIPKPGERIEYDNLKAHCRTYLHSSRIPKYIVALDELPRGPSGKIQRRLIPALLNKD